MQNPRHSIGESKETWLESKGVVLEEIISVLLETLYSNNNNNNIKSAVLIYWVNIGSFAIYDILDKYK